MFLFSPKFIYCSLRMPASRYSQLHRKLLFHWTRPAETPVVKTRTDRLKYLDLLNSILRTGLWFSTPAIEDTEWIERGPEQLEGGGIRATHPMICFSEWGIAESGAHSGRYGLMGLGFTRKFVMRVGGRPVVYLPNTRSDPFRRAIIEVIRAAREGRSKDSRLYHQADLLTSYLKAYHFKRLAANRPTGAQLPKKSKPSELPTPPDDHHLRVDFGGILANLEDREWRAVATSKAMQARGLSFSPGELAMIVFPDHQTLSLAMGHNGIMDWIKRPEMPSVCLLSREMIMSM